MAWALWLVVVAGAIEVPKDKLSSVIFAAGGKNVVVAIGDKADKVAVSVKVRDTGSDRDVAVIPLGSKGRIETLAKVMHKDDIECGLLIDPSAHGWNVTSLGACNLEPSLEGEPPPVSPTAPSSVQVSGKDVGTRTGWTLDPTRLLAEVKLRRGVAGGFVVDASEGDAVVLAEVVVDASELSADPIQVADLASAIRTAAKGASRPETPCGVVLDAVDDRPAWRVYTVGSCPRGFLHDEVDLRIQAATGEERTRLEAEDAALASAYQAEEQQRLARVQAVVPYAVPTPIDVSSMGLAPMSFSGLELRTDQETFDATGLLQRKVANRILQGAGYTLAEEGATGRFALEGWIVELAPWKAGPWNGYVLGVDWQLRDTQADRVIYAVRTRGWLNDTFAGTGLQAAEELLARTLTHLLSRQGFVDKQRGATQGTLAERAWDGGVAIAQCGAGKQAMPAAAPTVTGAAVSVQAGASTGSGVQISPDGWVLTAFHVVGLAKDVKVLRPGGVAIGAQVVRADPELDVALLHVKDETKTCLPIGAVPAVGATVYAIGSPSGLDFSLSRGIVSAVRDQGRASEVQTDASVSPGNSGGPLVDASGRVTGVVISKVVGEAVEGIAFAVPAQEALSGLEVQLAATTTAKPDALAAEWEVGKLHVVDVPDEMPGAGHR